MDATSARAQSVIRSYDGPPIRIMEVCGTHTHEIFRLGLRNLLPPSVRMISGPGCPVCVTPSSYIDEAVWLAVQKKAIICTFGDLVRVPGSNMSLAEARSGGADVRMAYSPLDAVAIADAEPGREVVFLSVGFETTTPAECLAVLQAGERGTGNFSLLTANRTMPRAYDALVGSADAFLYPGHVCAITGTAVCEALTRKNVSGVVAGFTAGELLVALATIVTRCREGGAFFENCYPRVVTAEGNAAAQTLVEKIMTPCDAEWRGLGLITGSGMKLRPEYAHMDARVRFAIPEMPAGGKTGCRCGEVLQGRREPPECPLFGKACTPQHPVGACMVSSEGACAAHYQYGGITREQ